MADPGKSPESENWALKELHFYADFRQVLFCDATDTCLSWKKAEKHHSSQHELTDITIVFENM